MLIFCVSLFVQNVTVTVIASGGLLLNAWVDFNVDGDWADPGEQIFSNVILSNGYNQLGFSVPSGTPTGAQTFARFRTSTQDGIGYTGFAPDGKVEDYQRILGMPAINDVIRVFPSDPDVLFIVFAEDPIDAQADQALHGGAFADGPVMDILACASISWYISPGFP